VEDALRAGAGSPELRLIETLLWDGAQYPRLAGHLARLTASAARLGWGCNPETAHRALHTAMPDTPSRVRLTLARNGQIAVTLAPLPASPAVWRLGLASVALVSSDPWLSVKSTNRAVYDSARADLTGDLDERIFRNEHGMVCDGTITTLFFDRGQGMCTPPLSCGLLPGVLRADMLGSGKAREATLAVHDLPHVRLWVGNALRGLMPAVWIG
jgi:4-amino-4-deoxychorismate lyase